MRSRPFLLASALALSGLGASCPRSDDIPATVAAPAPAPAPTAAPEGAASVDPPKEAAPAKGKSTKPKAAPKK